MTSRQRDTGTSLWKSYWEPGSGVMKTEHSMFYGARPRRYRASLQHEDIYPSEIYRDS